MSKTEGEALVGEPSLCSRIVAFISTYSGIQRYIAMRVYRSKGATRARYRHFNILTYHSKKGLKLNRFTCSGTNEAFETETSVLVIAMTERRWLVVIVFESSQ